jgi:DNA-binding GntR family transcriptional regulator
VRPRVRAADTGARVYELIRAKAASFELRPGAHVNELALASELNVSRTPVREALNRLASEGLMTLVPNKGFFRQPLDIEVIRSLFEVRMAIELLSVRLFVERATDNEVGALRAEWHALKPDGAAATPETIVTADEEFHVALARGGRNQEVVRLLGEINARIRFVRTVAMETPTFRDGAFVEHDAIIDAIATRDQDNVADLMTRHIRLTLDDVTALVRESVVKIYLSEDEAAPVSDNMSSSTFS